MLMVILLLITGLMCALLKKRKVAYICFCSLLWILMAGCIGGADYYFYKLNYEQTVSYNILGWEALYQISVLLAKSFGLNFRSFLMIYAAVGIFLISSTFYRLSKSGLALFLYFIYPFCMDVTQIRNFMCTAIVIYSFRFLLKDETKNVIRFLVCILIAAGFHRTGIIFATLLLLKLLEQRKLIVLAMLIVAFTPFIYVFLEKAASLISYIPAEKIHYFVEGTALRTKILVFIYLIISCVFFRYIYRRMSAIYDKNSNRIFEYVYLVNIVCLMFYPLFIASVSFLRLHRLVALANYIAITNYTIKRERFLIYFAGITYALVSFIAFIGLYNWNSVVKPIFKLNWMI